ncbi:NUDIX domain-containing protein [bacterium]|nr:NUDIX domain-containing protein [bacterium]
METTRVGIAIVEHCGQFLVGIRGADQVLAGRAEFPGGKCEPGETAAACAVRECLEEAGVPVVATHPLDQTEHEYEHGRVALEFWLCRVAEPERSTPQNGFRWISRNELAKLDFPEANRRVIEQIHKEFQ